MAWDGKKIKGVFSHPFTLKVFSLLLACGLWLLVNAGERDIEKDLLMSLELRNLPPQLVVTSLPVDSVNLRVMGPRILLGRIHTKKVAIDLTGVRPGFSSFEVTPEMFPLPRGVRVVRISPSKINLGIDQIIRKNLPVQANLVGKVPFGFTRVDTEISPDTVEVTGPAAGLEGLKVLLTEPIDVGFLTQPLTKEVSLQAPGEMVTYAPSRVNVRLSVREVVVEREFRRVKIQVKNTPGRYLLTPHGVDVTVRGPQRVVDELTLDSGEVFVDAAGEEAPDARMLPVYILLPPGVEVVRQDPMEAQLKLFRDSEEESLKKQIQKEPVPGKQKERGGK
ncbi:MAG: YbbR-like domain-containing protein [Deltaproteobacteria bacterium]|nr:YbbR-like domain-containing protein [Deltaproteobacteria bacterium]